MGNIRTDIEPHSNKTSIVKGSDRAEVNKILSIEK